MIEPIQPNPSEARQYNPRQDPKNWQGNYYLPKVFNYDTQLPRTADPDSQLMMSNTEISYFNCKLPSYFVNDASRLSVSTH